MKRSKQILAMLLAVVMVIGLIPTSIFATTPAVSISEDFEDFTAFGLTESVKGGTVSWNGSTAGLWKGYVDDNKGTLTVLGSGGVEDSKCVQIGLNGSTEALSRLSLTYQTTSQLEQGETYVLTVWAKKSADADMKLRYQTQYKTSGNPSGEVDVTTEWVKYPYEFTVEGTLKNFKLVVGASKATTGYLYIDNVTLTKQGDTTDILAGGDFEEFTAYAGSTELVLTTGSSDINVNGAMAGLWKGTYKSGEGYLIVNGDEGRNGGKCVEIQLNGEDDTTDRLNALYTNTEIQLEVGKTYVLTVWAKTTNTDMKIMVQPQYKSQGNPTQYFDSAAGLSNEWKEFTYEFTTELTGTQTLSSHVKILLSQQATDEAGSVYFDDVSLKLKGGEEEDDDPLVGVNLLTNGGFEESVDNAATGQLSTKTPSNLVWNGADPTTGAWSIYVDSGSIQVDVVKDPAVAQEGNYCVKITPSGTSRGLIRYSIPKADLVVGAEYTLGVWFKGTSDVNFDGRIQTVQKASGNSQVYPKLTTEWAYHEQTFVYSGDRDPVQINLGMRAEATTGSIFIDNVTLVRVAKAESVELDAGEVWLEPTNTKQLTATVKPADLGLTATFKSSNEAVATVSETGLVTAVAPGEAIITATAEGGASTTCKVYVVNNYVALTGIALNKSTLNVTPGWQEKLEVVFTPADATNKAVTWSSSDSTTVKVDENGNIVALKAGSATIKAVSGSFEASCTVTVAEDPDFQSKTDSLNVDFGHSNTVDLSTVLAGTEYTVISAPANGMVALDGSKVTYTAYTWLMDQGVAQTEQAFKDYATATFTDTMLIAVKSGDKTATITLNVGIGSVKDLFYDDQGNWISDVELVLTQEKLEYIRSQVTVEGSLYKDQLETLIKALDSQLNANPAKYVKPNYGSATSSYDGNGCTIGDQAVAFLVGYLVTKDVPGYEAKNERYLSETIEWLTCMLDYPFWGTLGYQNNDRCGGHNLFAAAMAYTWLQEELKNKTVDQRLGTDGSSEEAWNNTVKTYEDQPFLEALEMRLWQAGRDMYSWKGQNYSYDCYVMNHLHIRMGGLMAAANALRLQANLTADQQAELIRWTGMALYKDGVAMDSLMSDGSSQEGASYWSYGAEWLVRGGLTAETALGIDMFAMTEVYKNSGDYMLYTMLPRDENTSTKDLFMMTGDCEGGTSPSTLLRWIAGEYGDANAQWLADQLESWGVLDVNLQWLGIISCDPTLEPEAPNLDETLHWFQDMDHVIARSDWTSNADMLSVKCGVPTGKELFNAVVNGTYKGNPDAGHSHPDANHITLYANGEYILIDDGNVDKYTSNHSTLLVNGKGQLGGDQSYIDEGAYIEAGAMPYMKVVASTEAYDYIVGDATQAYDKSLGLYMFERNILYLKDEQVMLVVDNIQAADGTKLELRWFHAESAEVIENRGYYTVFSKKNTMQFYHFTETAQTGHASVEYHGTGVTTSKKAFQQTLTGSAWQNATAFSWNDADKTPAAVTYEAGAANLHKFAVNGKVYTIDVATNTVTVTTGTVNNPDTDAAKDSSIAAISINGEFLEGFKSDKTEYQITKDLDLAQAELAAYPSAQGATVEVKVEGKTMTFTCTSADGSSKTVYTVKLAEGLVESKLPIVGAESDVNRDGYDLASSYDGIVTVNNTGSYWTVQAPESGKITVTYDFGEVMRLQKVNIAMQNSKSRTNYYDLLVSTDGLTWTTVQEMAGIEPTLDISNNNHAFRTVLENANLIARYMRIVLRGNVSGTTDNRDKAGVFSGINEIEAYGWRLSSEIQEIPVMGAVSDVNRDGYDLASSYDGIVTVNNTGSYWTVQAPESGKITVTYDLGKVHNVQKIDLAMQNSKSRTNYYDLLISTDGVTWITVQEMAGIEPTLDISSNNHAFRTIVNGEELIARYVRVVLRGNVSGTTDNRDKAGVYSGINEITFYGKAVYAVDIGSETTGADFTIVGEKDFYESGDEITVTAKIPEGKKFVNWIVEGAEVASGDLTKETITVTVNGSNIKLTAVYANAETDEGPGEGPSPTGDSTNMMLAGFTAMAALAACLWLVIDKKRKISF